jgi:hypothetical protein
MRKWKRCQRCIRHMSTKRKGQIACLSSDDPYRPGINRYRLIILACQVLLCDTWDRLFTEIS